MVSGSRVEREINDKISSLQDKYRTLTRRADRCEDRVISLSHEREGLYAQLAVKYLPEMDSDSVQKTLKEVRGEVEQLFEQKKGRQKQLEKTLLDLDQSKISLQLELDKITIQLEGKVRERDKLMQSVDMRLLEHTEYKDLGDKAEQAKELIAQEDRRAKTYEEFTAPRLVDFRQDKRFSYLMKRKFGTDNYKGKGLSARFDNWLAEVVDYTAQKEDYDLQKGIPDHIAHEKAIRQDALEDVVGKMEAIENRESQDIGLVDVIKEGKEIGQKREEMMSQIEEIDSKYKRLYGEKKELATNKGFYYKNAVKRLKTYLKGSKLATLRRTALASPDPEDDVIVERIETINAGISQIKRKSKHAQSQADDVEDQLDGLKDIRRKFRRKDYESRRSYFPGGFDMDSLLTGYLVGTYNSRQLWNKIDRGQRFKPKQTYRSSNYNSYRSTSRRSSPTISMPSISVSTPSFSTGGSISSSSFSTGGGF